MKRRDRKTWRRVRRRTLFKQLRLQAELLCESHRDDAQRQNELMGDMLRGLLELIPANKVNDERREALAKAMEKCAYGPSPVLEHDGDMLIVNGTFSVSDLSKRVVWGHDQHQPWGAEFNG